MTGLSKIFTVTPSGSVNVQRVADRLLGFVLHDEQVLGMSRPEWNDKIGRTNNAEGLPETVRFEDSYSDQLLLRPMQEFWYGLLKRANPSMSESDMINAWRSLTVSGRAFTDGCSWSNGRADFIQDLNIGSKPMGFNTMVTGGAVVEILDNGDQHVLGGTTCYRVSTINANDISQNLDPNLFNHDTKPWLVFYATISRRDGTVIKFPQLNGADVPVPLFGNKEFGYIAADRIQLLPIGTPIPSCYVP